MFCIRAENCPGALAEALDKLARASISASELYRASDGARHFGAIVCPTPDETCKEGNVRGAP